MALTLIREERIAVSGDGLQLEDDLFIKLDAAFDGLVAELGRGGQLPALIHIYLREAHASSGRGDPATLKTIGAAASCQERQARRIVRTLLAKSLIAEAGLSPSTGEKFYRPIAYAWFGNKHPCRHFGVSSMTPQNGDRGVIRHPPVLVVDVEIPPLTDKEEQQTTKTRAILKKMGIAGKPLERLAENVAPATARKWAEWLALPHPELRNPIGVVVSALLADPDARPALPEKVKRTARPTVTGRLAALARSEPQVRGKFDGSPNADENDHDA